MAMVLIVMREIIARQCEMENAREMLIGVNRKYRSYRRGPTPAYDRAVADGHGCARMSHKL